MKAVLLAPPFSFAVSQVRSLDAILTTLPGRAFLRIGSSKNSFPLFAIAGLRLGRMGLAVLLPYFVGSGSMKACFVRGLVVFSKTDLHFCATCCKSSVSQFFTVQISHVQRFPPPLSDHAAC